MAGHLSARKKLESIGLRISEASVVDQSIDIEDALVTAIVSIDKDPELLGLILSWILVHGNYVIVEKLAKYARRYKADEQPGILWMTAVASFAFHCGLHKWKKLKQVASKRIYFPSETEAENLLKTEGSVIWLDEESNIVIPAGAVKIDAKYVISPIELMKRHEQFRNRYLYGVSWRSDIITAIENGMNSPTKIARELGCSYEPAHRILREYRLFRASRKKDG